MMNTQQHPLSATFGIDTSENGTYFSQKNVEPITLFHMKYA